MFIDITPPDGYVLDCMSGVPVPEAASVKVPLTGRLEENPPLVFSKVWADCVDMEDIAAGWARHTKTLVYPNREYLLSKFPGGLMSGFRLAAFSSNGYTYLISTRNPGPDPFLRFATDLFLRLMDQAPHAYQGLPRGRARVMAMAPTVGIVPSVSYYYTLVMAGFDLEAARNHREAA